MDGWPEGGDVRPASGSWRGSWRVIFVRMSLSLCPCALLSVLVRGWGGYYRLGETAIGSCEATENLSLDLHSHLQHYHYICCVGTVFFFFAVDRAKPVPPRQLIKSNQISLNQTKPNQTKPDQVLSAVSHLPQRCGTGMVRYGTVGSGALRPLCPPQSTGLTFLPDHAEQLSGFPSAAFPGQVSFSDASSLVNNMVGSGRVGSIGFCMCDVG